MRSSVWRRGSYSGFLRHCRLWALAVFSTLAICYCSTVSAQMDAPADASRSTDPAAAVTKDTVRTVDAARRSIADQGDIVVTARNRSESLQRVPDAITAFSAETITRSGIQTFAGFANKPDVSRWRIVQRQRQPNQSSWHQQRL